MKRQLKLARREACVGLGAEVTRGGMTTSNMTATARTVAYNSTELSGTILKGLVMFITKRQRKKRARQTSTSSS